MVAVIKDYQIEFRPATDVEEQSIRNILDQYGYNAGVPLPNPDQLSLFAYFENKLIGYLIGKTYSNWLYVDLLWIEPNYRNSGLGARLMHEAETKVRARGYTAIYLWTGSWEAPEFYKKLGYEEFTRFENFPPGHTRIGFRKYL